MKKDHLSDDDIGLALDMSDDAPKAPAAPEKGTVDQKVDLDDAGLVLDSSEDTPKAPSAPARGAVDQKIQPDDAGMSMNMNMSDDVPKSPVAPQKEQMFQKTVSDDANLSVDTPDSPAATPVTPPKRVPNEEELVMGMLGDEPEAPAQPEENNMKPQPEPDSGMVMGMAEEEQKTDFAPEPEKNNMNEGLAPPAEEEGSTGKELVAPKPVATKEKEGGNRRIGDELIEQGIITPDQLNVALQEKKITGKMLGEVLVDLGFIDSDILSGFLSESSGFPVFDPKSTIIDTEALEMMHKSIAIKHLVLPFSLTKDAINVAMVDPYDVVALDIMRNNLPRGLKINPHVTSPKILNDAIESAYGYASSINAILKELEGQGADDLDDVTTLNEDEAYSHPLVRLVNALIFEAVKIGASDLHFEPEENFVRLRYRIDGVLVTSHILHSQHWQGISQRIKLMANLNIADKLSAQDGRFQMNMIGRDVDFRTSTLPTVFGENIVLRVLDKQAGIMSLSDLGFSDHNLNLIRKAQKKPEGIIIVTGPTGSGKTTSLYSMLNEINKVDVNIKTLEDPVEYSLPMIRQTQVREGVLEFADGIRSILRQDPDVILIGEIRDKTTAEMALQASMTGHQVYTTLHTNDSLGALPRLFDLGMVPGMIAGAITAVFAQRLGRLLCPNCKQEHQPTDEEIALLGVSDIPTIYKAKKGGCDHCLGQGYKGRTAMVEILSFDEEMDDIVASGGTKADIKAHALKKGFKTMRHDAIEKVLDGKTSLEAISKVVDMRE